MKALTRSEDLIIAESLDILAELLRRFGSALSTYHSAIQGVVLPHLQHARSVVRKRSITCLSRLSASASDALLSDLTDKLFGEFEKKKAQV